VSIVITRPPPKIQVSPGSMTFTASVGSSKANESINVQIANVGASGSLLNYSLTDTTGGRLIVSGSQTQIPSGSWDLLTFTFNTSNLSANTYSDTLYVTPSDNRASQVAIPLTIVIKPGTTTYVGSFTGWVKNDANQDQGGDPTLSFPQTSYGGTAVITVTPVSGAYKVQLTTPQGLHQAIYDPAFGYEDFTTNIGLVWNGANLSLPFDFGQSVKFANGDGYMKGSFTISGSVVQGSWQYV
jgi:hypothetical protein